MPMTQPDPSLLDEFARRAATGDEEAFRSLLLATQAEIRLHLAARAPIDLVEELVQSTYVEAWSALSGYQPQGLLVAWLKGIARNLLLRELRERSRRRRLQRADLASLVCDPAEPAAEADEEGLLQRLRACQERLPQAARDLLHRRYVDGAGLEDLAAVLGCDREAIAARLYRLRNALRLCMERGVAP